jgi:hypothetical protein
VPTIPTPASFTLALLLAAAPFARADTITLVPIADAMVASAHSASNYGGAGSICVSAPGLTAGEFQSVLRFDTSAAVVQFNTTFGAGQWSVGSCSLQLTAFDPLIPFFNPQAAGQFAVSWMANDSWVEGTGTPSRPTAVGITFDTLPAFLGPSDELLGTFAFAGAISGSNTYTLALTPGFRADIAAGTDGGGVSIRLFTPPGSVISYLSNSRSYTVPSSYPMLTITAIPLPPPCPADFNHSGSLTVQDIFDFLASWFAGSPAADFNHANGLGVQDIFDFLTAWFAGCP